VKNFAWSPDGKQIAYLAPDAKTEAEEKKEKDKDDARVVDKEDKHARLWLLTLGTGEAKALTTQMGYRETVWHPSGTGLMLSATDHPESDQNTERIFPFVSPDVGNSDHKVVDSMAQVLAPRGPFGNIRIAADARGWRSSAAAKTARPPHDLMLARHGEKGVQNLTGASVDRPVLDFRWSKDGVAGRDCGRWFPHEVHRFHV